MNYRIGDLRVRDLKASVFTGVGWTPLDADVIPSDGCDKLIIRIRSFTPVKPTGRVFIVAN